MEPLSVATSIMTVAGALYAVSRKFRDYAKTIAYAAKEVKAIAKEISVFSILLRSFRDTYDVLTSQVPQAADLLGVCKKLVAQAKENVREFDTFLEGLNPLIDSRDAGLISKTIARLRWAFQRTDLLLLRSKLESSKSTLNLCMCMIQTKISAEMYVTAKRGEGDQTEVERLRNQLRLLKSQLHEQRSILKHAIAASTKIERLVQGQVRKSVNQAVANKTLGVARRQLEEYKDQSYAEVNPPYVFAASNNPSPPPSPSRHPSLPPSPPFQGPPASHAQQTVIPRPAGLRSSTMAADITPSGKWVFDRPSQPISKTVDQQRHGVPPMATGSNIDMGYRTARTLGQRRGRGSRIRDAASEVVREENHDGDDEGP